MILVLLAVFSATFQPPRPTVGDRIVINFPAPVVLDASKDYEVVAQKGNRVVIRSFQPAPFALSGTSGNVRFQNLVVPMTSTGPMTARVPGCASSVTDAVLASRFDSKAVNTAAAG